MKAWNEITHYAGFDWARDHHDVIIVEARGQIVADFQIEHSAAGWQPWREQIAALGEGVAACVEPSRREASEIGCRRQGEARRSGSD